MSDNLRRLKDKASRAYADGRLKSALELYAEVVQGDPRELQCRLKIGDIHRKLGNLPEAVEAYSPVAKAYAEDGLLLKAVAVCKMILNVDGRHTATQDMLADLYAKRRGPARSTPFPPPAGPAVTLRGLGVSPPPAAPGGDYGMVAMGSGSAELELDTDPRPNAWPGTQDPASASFGAVENLDLEAADRTPKPSTPAWLTGASPVAPTKAAPGGWPVIQGKPAAPASGSWPVESAGSGAPPASGSWPVGAPASGAPPASGSWPVGAPASGAPPVSGSWPVGAPASGAPPVSGSWPVESPGAGAPPASWPVGSPGAGVPPAPPKGAVVPGAVAPGGGSDAASATSAPELPDAPQTQAPLSASWPGGIAPAGQAPPSASWPPRASAEEAPAKVVMGQKLDAPWSADVADGALDVSAEASAEEGGELADAADGALDVSAEASAEEGELEALLGQLSDEDGRPAVDVIIEPLEAPDEEAPIPLGSQADARGALHPVDPSVDREAPIALGSGDAKAPSLEETFELTDVVLPDEEEVVELVEAHLAAEEGDVGFDDGDLEDLGTPQIPLFSDLPKKAFIELLVQMEMKTVEPGEYVIREGEVGDSFFVVATGCMRVTRKDEAGRDVVLAQLTDGAFFGEMALLQDDARTASVLAETESQLFEIKKAVLDRVVAQFPSVARVIQKFYQQRLLSTAMATHPMFRPFTPDQRRELMALFKSRTFSEGEVVLEEGKKGNGLFLVLHGALEVTKEKEGRRIALALLGAGDMFGEMSLLTGRPTVAQVGALTDCFVLRMSKKKFDELIMTHPQILELVSNLSEERATLNDALMGEGQNTPPVAVLV